MGNASCAANKDHRFQDSNNDSSANCSYYVNTGSASFAIIVAEAFSTSA